METMCDRHSRARIWQGTLICAGIMAHMAIQVILNIAVVTKYHSKHRALHCPLSAMEDTSVVFLLGEMGLALKREQSQTAVLYIYIERVRGSLGVKSLDDQIRIVGGKPLKGNISIQGSKNAALPMMAASLLHRGLSVLKGMSQRSQMYFAWKRSCKDLGAVTWWEDHDLYHGLHQVQTNTEIPGRIYRKNAFFRDSAWQPCWHGTAQLQDWGIREAA